MCIHNINVYGKGSPRTLHKNLNNFSTEITQNIMVVEPLNVGSPFSLLSIKEEVALIIDYKV